MFCFVRWCSESNETHLWWQLQVRAEIWTIRMKTKALHGRESVCGVQFKWHWMNHSICGLKSVFDVYTLQFATECFWIWKWIEFIRAITRVKQNKYWIHRHIPIMRARERNGKWVVGTQKRKYQNRTCFHHFYWNSKTTTFWMSYYLYLIFVACGVNM